MQTKFGIILAGALAIGVVLAAGCKSGVAEEEYLNKKRWEKAEAEKATLQTDLDRLRLERLQARADLEKMRGETRRTLEERERQWAAEAGGREKEISRLKKALADAVGAATIRGNGVAVPMAGDVLFDSGKTFIKKDGRRVLQKLQGKIKEVLTAGGFEVEYIRIDGHTDTDPIKHARTYKDNWMLGAARANAVRAYLKEVGGWDDYKMYIASYAYTEPATSGDTKAAKAANRRVEIFIVPAPKSRQP